MKRVFKLTGISLTSAAMCVFTLGLLLGSFKIPSYAAWSAQRTLAAEAAKSRETFRLYRTADYATAKHALLEDIRRNDQLSGKCRKPNMFSADVIMDYARLAKLSEKNNQPGSQEYMQQAIDRCSELKSRYLVCSESYLRGEVERTDKLNY